MQCSDRSIARPLTACFLAALCLALGQQAQARYSPFESFSEIDGLPSSAVFGICQDDLGQMWFGTRVGLVSFDGVEWTDHNRDPGLPDRIFTEIDKDGQGRLWVASQGHPFQVALQDSFRWQTLPPVQSPSLDWLAQGFQVHTRADGTTIAALFSYSGFLRVWDGAHWRELAPQKTFANIHAMLFVEDRLLVAAETGLFSVDLDTWQLTADPLPGVPRGTVFTLANRGDGTPLWLVGTRWLGQFHDGRFQMLNDDLDFQPVHRRNPVMALADRSGDLFIGDWQQTFFYVARDNRLEPLHRYTATIQEGSNAIFEDREGFIWFSGMRRVDKLGSPRFTCYNDQHGLFSDEVSSILIRRDGTAVLGHGGGLTFMESTLSTQELPVSFPASARVFDLAEAANGEIWLAVDQLGVARLDQSRNLTWHRLKGDSDNRAFSLDLDDHGRIWVGTHHGVQRFDDGRLEEVPFSAPYQDAHFLIRRVLAGEDGDMFAVAASAGIFRFKDGKSELFVQGSITDLSFYSLCPDFHGGYWVATSRGLFVRAKDGSLARVPEGGPIINRPTYSIVRDQHDRFWFGTDTGVAVWDGTDLRWFTAREGLLGNDTNRDALQVDTRGRIWIGTERGLSIFDSDYDMPAAAPPLLEFLGFEADGASIPLENQGHLKRPPGTLFANFRGISFADQRTLSISTMLEGFDSDWQPATPWSQRTNRYTNLPPGTFRFRAQVVQGDERIGPEITSTSIIIAKPFWSRWWFILLVSVSCLVLLWVLISWTNNRKYNVRLLAEVEDRTRQLLESEAEVRAESQRFAATLNSVAEAVLNLDDGGRVILSNPAAETVFGLPAEKIKGCRLQDLLGLDDGNAIISLEHHPYAHPEGSQTFLDCTSAPILADDGTTSGQVAVLRDVTEQLRRQDEVARTQKLESLGLLAGGLAHDFNNLLTAIRGNIEMAETDEAIKEESRKFLEKSRNATLRARSLTEQLLTFSLGGAPELKAMNLGETIEQAAELAFSGRAHTRHLDIDQGLWPVEGDSGQLNQVFSNLFINACQALPAGGHVTVKACNLDLTPAGAPDGRYVRVEVTDNGPGIPLNDLTRIFDPYFSTKTGGTGLGLATVFSIVKRHGGMLEAESPPGQGATFRIFLPASASQVVVEEQPKVRTINSGQRVLVMDDEKDVRLVIKAFLERMGVTATLTENGEQAVAAYLEARDKGRPFHAVLFDLTVPGAMGGKDALVILRDQDPDLKAVVISGYSNDAVLSDYAQYGFSAALSKPFAYQEFTEVLAKLLN